MTHALATAVADMDANPDAPIPFSVVARIAPLTGDSILNADARIDDIETAADAFAHATAYEQELEDRRQVMKEGAIIRIMELRKIASTPAEKLVQFDEEFQAFRKQQRDSVIARIRAEGAYEAAKRSADLEIALVTLSAIASVKDAATTSPHGEG